MNSINLIGNICNDLELKQTNSGKSVCSFNLAVKRPLAKEVTDFLPIVVWNKQAENLCTYCGKGSRIAVSGIMTTRTYEKDGNNRTAYEVMANEVIFLEKKADGQSNTVDNSSLPSPDGFAPMGADDDLPF
jgi:single-strand DNA-binding protein